MGNLFPVSFLFVIFTAVTPDISCWTEDLAELMNFACNMVSATNIINISTLELNDEREKQDVVLHR